MAKRGRKRRGAGSGAAVAEPPEEPTVMLHENDADEGTRKYWMGATKQCPWQTVNVRGGDFPLFVNKIDKTGDGREKMGSPLPGIVRELTDSQVKTILAEVDRKVVRLLPSGRSFILNTDDEGYTKAKEDRPLGKFVYLVALDELDRGYVRELDQHPPTLV